MTHMHMVFLRLVLALATQAIQTSAGWVGVQTYMDSDNNLRVKKEVLVAMSGITTGNPECIPS